MFYGYIKNIAADRGFGFIDTGGRQDVYFHAVDIGNEVFAQLQINQPVMFEFAKRDREVDPAEKKGPRAVVVKILHRMPGGLMQRPPQELAPRHHPKARQRKATWKRPIHVRKKSADGAG